VRWFLGLTGRERPRVCFLPTAVGDSDAAIVTFYERFPAGLCEPSHVTLFGVPRADVRGHLLAQDAIYVSGGNTANMLAVFAVHGVDVALREAWEAGVVLGGPSAGGICWFEAGITDSFGPELALLPRALGFLPGSFCPHYDGEPERRPTYERLVREHALPPGLAADDAVALHFEGTDLTEVVTERAGATAYRVESRGDGVVETPLDARLLA
jgi:peptidase E